MESIFSEAIPKTYKGRDIPKELHAYILLDLYNNLVKRKRLERNGNDIFSTARVLINSYNFDAKFANLINDRGYFDNTKFLATKSDLINEAEDSNLYDSNNSNLSFEQRKQQIQQLISDLDKVLNNSDKNIDPDVLRDIFSSTWVSTFHNEVKGFEELEQRLSAVASWQVFDSILDQEISSAFDFLIKDNIDVEMGTLITSTRFAKIFFGLASLSSLALLFEPSFDASILLSTSGIATSLMGLLHIGEMTLKSKSDKFFGQLYDIQSRILRKILDEADKNQEFEIDGQVLLLRHRFERISQITDDNSQNRKNALDRFVFNRISKIMEERVLTDDEVIYIYDFLSKINLNNLQNYTENNQKLLNIVTKLSFLRREIEDKNYIENEQRLSEIISRLSSPKAYTSSDTLAQKTDQSIKDNSSKSNTRLL